MEKHVNEGSILDNPQMWILLPPGDRAICRVAMAEVPPSCRLATSAELLVANVGRPFPWGHMPTPDKASRLWKEKNIGYGGLYHDKWFVTADGRLGGAENVPRKLPGSLRSCLLYDGGPGGNEENEGYAVIRDIPLSRDLYRRIQIHAAEHVMADGGHIIVSPPGDKGTVYVGFVGRCQTCPNPELISFRQLQAAVPGINFELYDEWKNWSLEPHPSAKKAFSATLEMTR